MEDQERTQTEQRIRAVQRELLDRHRNWTPDKARWVAMKLLCLTH